MARLTRNSICKAIEAKHGVKVNLWAAYGYFIFHGDDDAETDNVGLWLAGLPTACIYVCQLNSFSIDRWVSEFEGLFDDADFEIADLKKPFPEYEPKILRFKKI